MYNSLLNLNFTNNTKTIAFADDLIILCKGETVIEAENYMNLEMDKISRWARNNKIQFNERKSKVMLMSRRKRRESKDIEIYLNHKLLEQVNILPGKKKRNAYVFKKSFSLMIINVLLAACSETKHLFRTYRNIIS